MAKVMHSFDAVEWIEISIGCIIILISSYFNILFIYTYSKSKRKVRRIVFWFTEAMFCFSTLTLLSSTIDTFVNGFYLPGIKHHEYEFQEGVKIKVNDYYQLPFCKPGEILTGDSIENSPYKVEMMSPSECNALCKKTYSKKDLHEFATKIDEKYRVNLILDKIAAAQKLKTKKSEDFIYEKGYPLGYVVSSNGKKLIMLNNHVDLIILYHGNHIVGFEVEPRSIQQCSSSDVLHIANPSIPESLDIIWSYSVIFEPSDIQWASRWDPYLKMQHPQIDWCTILNSFMIVIFLSGMVAMVLMGALQRDLRRYNADPSSQELDGWILVHSDVFRTPYNPSLFASIIGTGVQILIMCLLSLVFAALGALSPANRASLITALLSLYVFMGIFAGYFSARTYKMFGEISWHQQTLKTALLFPAINFIIVFILNLFVYHQGSSDAVPFGTMFSLFILWFVISVPFVYLGAYFGYKKNLIQFPCSTNEILRIIPQQPWYVQKYFAILVGGVLPFGAVFIQIFFIMNSIWLHHYYYMFAFLLLVFIILILTSAEITIVMTYFQLSNQDWRWWWRSVLTAGSSAIYLFLYSILYFYTTLDIIYFGYMILVSLALFLVTGTIGFYATYVFVWKIYDAIKIE